MSSFVCSSFLWSQLLLIDLFYGPVCRSCIVNVSSISSSFSRSFHSMLFCSAYFFIYRTFLVAGFHNSIQSAEFSIDLSASMFQNSPPRASAGTTQPLIEQPSVSNWGRFIRGALSPSYRTLSDAIVIFHIALFARVLSATNIPRWDIQNGWLWSRLPVLSVFLCVSNLCFSRIQCWLQSLVLPLCLPFWNKLNCRLISHRQICVQTHAIDFMPHEIWPRQSGQIIRQCCCNNVHI